MVQTGRELVDAPPAYGAVGGMQPLAGDGMGMAGESMNGRRRGCCGRAGRGGYERTRCRGPVRAVVGYLIQ